MRRWLLSLLVFITTVPAIAQDDGACTPADGAPLTVGAVFPRGNLLTRQAELDFQGADAMRMAVNACGGVNGRPVEFASIEANDRGDAVEAVATLRDDGVSVIVGSGNPAVADGAAETEGVVYWEMTESRPTTATEWVFSPRPDNRQLGERAALYASEVVTGQTDEPLRVALIFEERTRSSEMADGARALLAERGQLVIEEPYDDSLFGTYNIGIQIRQQNVNTVIFSGFDDDGERLWYSLREADANILAWLHIGSEGYRQTICNRPSSAEGFIGVNASGPVDNDARRASMGGVYEAYREIYLRENSAIPTPDADLSAAGVYTLLTDVLPRVEGDIAPETVRAAILAQSVPVGQGMFGEGLQFEGGRNLSSQAIVRQQQGPRFCTLAPGEYATCVSQVRLFEDWRSRAIAEESGVACIGTEA